MVARLLLLAVAARALQPLQPCRATRRRHLVSVRAEPEPDVDELKRNQTQLRWALEAVSVAKALVTTSGLLWDDFAPQH